MGEVPQNAPRAGASLSGKVSEMTPNLSVLFKEVENGNDLLLPLF